MRVISGAARGRNLIAPTGLNTRPTGDKIKESLFNIIAPRINGCIFLDLYSGSGAIGIEALSRGAERAVFVENNRDAISAVIQNLENTKFSNAELIKVAVSSAISILASRNESFDIIFMDPPYLLNDYFENVSQIISGKLLKPGGLLIIEHSQKIELSISISGLSTQRVKQYGKETAITFLEFEEKYESNISREF